MICPVCSGPVEVMPAVTKSGKPSLSFRCRRSGAHYRGFINDQDYVRGVIDQAGGQDRNAR